VSFDIMPIESARPYDRGGTGLDPAGRGPWIQTAPSNSKFYLADPRPEDIHVEDVARHLSGIFRCTGSSRYSVAQHCVVAARMAERHYTNYRHSYLPAKMLVHDSGEAFYGDVSSPLKSLLPDYRYYEALGEAALEKRFDICWVDDSLVKEIDRRMLLSERPLYFTKVLPWDGDWNMAEGLKPFELDEEHMERWHPDEAEAEWLSEFRRLLPWVEF
jgi:hypothetical protein